MLNTKYYKDLNHNYLIIKEKIKQKEGNYQHKMITSNRMKHFLECKIRYVDEESHFYYEISSKQSLSNLFADKKIGYEELCHLFEHMQEALLELENYMLDSRRLILQPEYIYVEPESKNYYFLYYPEDMETEEIATQMSLAQFLVDKTDHEQENAVAVAYKVYEMMQDGQFVLSGVMDMFSKSEMTEEQSQCIETYMDKYEKEPISGIDNDEDEGLDEENEGSSDTADRHLFAAGILMLICFAAAAGIFCLRCLVQLSVQENLFAVVGIGVLVAVSAFFLLYLIFNLWVQTNGRQKRKDEKSGFEAVSSIQGTGMNRDEKEEEYGNTVFLEASVMHRENKLYGMNKGNKYHIDLNKLPCTIGKMAGGVDIVIRDSTISRIHARFTRQENGICVTDLNSTNGSFKNGLRLEPNETVLIEPGDELRFGRMTFCYR